MRLRTEQVVERPLADVFRFVALDHFVNHPQWDPSIVELAATSPGVAAVGASARLVRVDNGRRTEGTMVVTDLDLDRRFAAVCGSGLAVTTKVYT